MSITFLMTGRILRRGLTGTISLLIGLFIFEFVQPLVANSVGGGAGIANLVDQLPPAFQAVLRTQPEFVAVSGLAGYLSIGFSHPIFFVLTSAILAALICRSLAGESESGTMQLALSRSISRQSVYTSRLIATLVAIVAVLIATFSGMVAGIEVGKPDGEFIYRHIIATAAVTFLLLWAIAGVTLLLSALADTTSQAIGWTTGFVVVSFVIDYLSGLWSVIKPISPLSIYHYFDPATALILGTVSTSDALVLMGVGGIGAIAGFAIFRNRDLPS
jgi:beta-exotoxin I transport system permease protein